MDNKLYTYILVENKWELVDEKEYAKLINRIVKNKLLANFGAVIKFQAPDKKTARKMIKEAIENDRQRVSA